mmetsp:Transcript_29081/g.69480  ORF Transcript_29081/g.69480 Transcript_29081/m.69480 type:complete len:542 (+) Transcript_29081:217-1842(+)|eukprot:CAMPEP_0177580906 /NCGR_PEP_ID=MMETSP0419_2-20121207/1840_1 /TAXON_ID=582737 /ORGANISM="Tetraselmis sp., Strain GSL018" /LENGTH=541 /DNA_ID=CAMNT_0019069865 /DNA_START=250 /DNA_END=1875 /DNA_ORIENTATION=+
MAAAQNSRQLSGSSTTFTPFTAGVSSSLGFAVVSGSSSGAASPPAADLDLNYSNGKTNGSAVNILAADFHGFSLGTESSFSPCANGVSEKFDTTGYPGAEFEKELQWAVFGASSSSFTQSQPAALAPQNYSAGNGSISHVSSQTPILLGAIANQNPSSMGSSQQGSKQGSKVFVGGLSWETTDQKLRQYFENYGEVIEAFVSYDKNTGRPRGFGFVVFAEPHIADKVVSLQHTIDRREVEAKRAVPRQDMTKAQQNSSSTDSTKVKKIFVGGLAPTVDEKSFREYFEQYGEVEDAVVMYDPHSSRPRGFGFVTFGSEESVDLVFLHGVMQELHDKQIEIKRAVPREEMVPPRRSRPNHNGSYSVGPNRASTSSKQYARQVGGIFTPQQLQPFNQGQPSIFGPGSWPQQAFLSSSLPGEFPQAGALPNPMLPVSLQDPAHGGYLGLAPGNMTGLGGQLDGILGGGIGAVPAQPSGDFHMHSQVGSSADPPLVSGSAMSPRRALLGAETQRVGAAVGDVPFCSGLIEHLGMEMCPSGFSGSAF